MRQKSGTTSGSSERIVKDIRRATRIRRSAEEKIRIVLDGLRGEHSVAELCRREGIAESQYYSWSKEFLEAGKTALAAGKSGPSTREEQLEAEVADLTQALGEAAVEIRVWKKSAEGRLGPSRTSR